VEIDQGLKTLEESKRPPAKTNKTRDLSKRGHVKKILQRLGGKRERPKTKKKKGTMLQVLMQNGYKTINY